MKPYAEELSRIRARITERERLYIVLRFRTPEPSDRELAEQLNISPATVGRYAENLHKKLGVRTRLEFFIMSVVLGLVPCPCTRLKERLGVA